MREVREEPCTKNTTGLAGSPRLGAPTRLRYIHRGTSPFFAQYWLLQISPASAAAALAGSAAAMGPARRPRPAPLISVRRASGFLELLMAFPLLGLNRSVSYLPLKLGLRLSLKALTPS